MSIGQELLNVPMGDMIRQMAFAIADGQAKLDENSINTAEMMGGLTTVYDAEGNVTFDDSRVFFGYEYMTLAEAVAYAIMDDAVTGALDETEAVKLLDLVKKVAQQLHGINITGTDGQSMIDGMTDEQKRLEIRVPTRLSMMELGFAPTFYQFVDTIIEVKIAIKITRTSEYTHTRRNRDSSVDSSSRRKRSFWGTSRSSSYSRDVATSQVDATYANKYSYSAEGASILRTKIVPVPVPTALEDRIQSFMQTEEARREANLEKRRTEFGLTNG
ncbi:hypothetical protein [Roseitranquillus sediminis]|uniref:hypothetical protein n=1 Tax=Roseitranquillus sediminis TaxID=2809051 RepID=UPI001D0CC22B|nr:hypothetical protein [Roseitranquillus sediminis]MBM9593567.1 hypothetical protein [Roseitranquillus sediminis]